jgi:hypothetical protein
VAVIALGVGGDDFAVVDDHATVVEHDVTDARTGDDDVAVVIELLGLTVGVPGEAEAGDLGEAAGDELDAGDRVLEDLP